MSKSKCDCGYPNCEKKFVPRGDTVEVVNIFTCGHTQKIIETYFYGKEATTKECTCVSHAQEKVCKTNCDNPTNNKPIIKNGR